MVCPHVRGAGQRDRVCVARGVGGDELIEDRCCRPAFDPPLVFVANLPISFGEAEDDIPLVLRAVRARTDAALDARGDEGTKLTKDSFLIK
jgi:hypothetical protein